MATSVATRGGRGGLRSYNPPSDGAPPGRPAAVLPRARGAGPRALARARHLPRVGPPPRGRRAVGLLGGPADGQRQARRPSRPRARVQGHLPALQDDARLPGRAQGRLGHARPAGRDRRPEAARDREQAGDRAVRDRRVQPALPRGGLRVPRGLERADRAHRLLDRPRRRLPHARRDVHRVGLVGAAPDPRQGAALRGPQGRALLPGLRHGALQPRGRARLSGRRRSERLRAPAGGRGRRPGAGGRRAARVDHHAVDPGLQRGGRGRPRARLRAGQGGPARRPGDRGRGASSSASSAPKAFGSSTASRARRSTACATSRPSRT